MFYWAVAAQIIQNMIKTVMMQNRKIKIPDSVTSIGDWAFYICSSLTDVYYGGSEEEWNQIEKDNIGTEATVHFE